MIVYNKEQLENFITLKDSETLAKSSFLSKLQLEKVEEEFPTNLYHPSFWIRIILFVFTLIGIVAAIGFFSISILVPILDNQNEIFGRVLAVFAGIGLLTYMEMILIKNKHHFKSGVQEAFLLLGLLLIIPSILWDSPEIVYSFTIFIISAVLVVRYLNNIMILVWLASFFHLIFLLCDMTIGIEFLPIILSISCLGIFLLSKRWEGKVQNRFYHSSFLFLNICTLLLGYLSVNYLVVRELSQELMHFHLQEGEDIPFAWLFYILTFLIPIIYLIIGLRKRSVLFLRVGLSTLVLGVIAIKFYYSSGHPEITLTISGILLTLLSIYLTNFLKEPVNGVTRDPLLRSKWNEMNIEGIIISSTMGGNASKTENQPEMGNGEFGGGGAGGEY